MVPHPAGGVLQPAQEGQALQAVPWRLQAAQEWGPKTWVKAQLSSGGIPVGGNWHYCAVGSTLS